MPSRFHAASLPAAADYAPWLQRLARLGYAAKGVVYVLVGYVAARAAFAAGSPTGSAGALRELLRNGGRWMVLVVAVGLAAHVVWRLVQAVRDPEHRDRNMGRRLFYLLSAVIYASLALSALRLWQGRPDSGGSGGSGGQEMLAAELLARPLGAVFVALVGIGVIGYAVHQLVIAFRGDLAKRLSIADGNRHRAVVAIGRVGIASRGIVLGILGTFFIQAALRHDADAAGGTEEVLRSFGSGWLLGAVALGLVAYGLFQFANAAYRRIPVP